MENPWSKVNELTPQQEEHYTERRAESDQEAETVAHILQMSGEKTASAEDVLQGQAIAEDQERNVSPRDHALNVARENPEVLRSARFQEFTADREFIQEAITENPRAYLAADAALLEGDEGVEMAAELAGEMGHPELVLEHPDFPAPSINRLLEKVPSVVESAQFVEGMIKALPDADFQNPAVANQIMQNIPESYFSTSERALSAVTTFPAIMYHIPLDFRNDLKFIAEAMEKSGQPNKILRMAGPSVQNKIEAARSHNG